MTFFYDLNKRLADLASKQDAKQITEEAKAVAPKSKLVESLEVAEAGYSAKAGRAGKDLGKPGKNFSKIAKSAGERYGSKAAGERVAGAVLNKLRHPKEDIENEGNAFGDAIRKAKADGIQKGETVRVGSKIYPVKEADMVGLAEKKKAKPDYIDLDGDGNKKETMKKAASDKKRSTGTAFDKEHMDKLRKEKEAETHSRYDVQDTGYSKRYTRKAVDTDVDKDDEVKSNEPKRKGRPKGPAKGPERTTKGAWKHKGDRKVKEEETDEGWRGGMLGEPSVVKTGKKDPNAKVEAWNGLMAIVARGEGMEPAVLKHLKQIARTLKPEELELDEEKVEAGKREFFDRLAPAAKKAAQVIKAISKSRIPVEEESTDKEDTKAEKAGKKVAKDIEHDEGHKGKDDNKAEKAGKKVTKDIEYDDKKDKEEKVDETADAPKAGKGMQFGKGVYEGFNSKVENMITEGMSINISVDEQGKKSISVNATEQDAEALADLLKMAGLGGAGGQAGSCPTCNQAPCGCAEVVDENSPDYPTNTETSDDALQYSGGLNGPKSTGQTTVPVVASQLRRQVSMEENVELERNLFKTWKNYKG
jgi:hypothetical protein